MAAAFDARDRFVAVVSEFTVQAGDLSFVMAVKMATYFFYKILPRVNGRQVDVSFRASAGHGRSVILMVASGFLTPLKLC